MNAMKEHIVQNPCLIDNWPDLWDRLVSAGWRRLEGPNNTNICYYVDVKSKYVKNSFKSGETYSDASPLMTPLLQKNLIPGQHLFVSKLATIQYIARCVIRIFYLFIFYLFIFYVIVIFISFHWNV